MILRGKAWKFGDNISTDHIIPGRFLHLRSNLEELKKHVFDDISPDFYKKANKGDIIVGGKNFGLGSSREHAPLVIKMVGIDAVVAPSFARIFFRNAINVGLAAIICDVDEVDEDDVVEITGGPFKGLRAKITRLDKSKGQVTLELLEATFTLPITVHSDYVKLVEKAKT